MHGLLLACDRILSTSPPETNSAAMPSTETKICHDITEAAECLRGGRLVAFPTETVYGLGADALNVSAVARIFESKGRPTFDPLIVHVADRSWMEDLVTDFPPLAQKLADQFWPGPLTLVLPKSDSVPDLVTAGLPAVGIRIPANPTARELIEAAGCPVAAPSANPFSGISPTTAQHVMDGLGGRIDAILDGGPCAVGLESTVVSFAAESPIVLRPGGLPIEQIESVTGPIGRAKSDPSADDSAQAAPGMLSRHYAPAVPMIVTDSQTEPTGSLPANAALLTWGRQAGADPKLYSVIRNLDPDGDLTRCAAQFFAALRALDAANPDVIIAHRFPNQGLGIALNDRLQRAAAR